MPPRRRRRPTSSKSLGSAFRSNAICSPLQRRLRIEALEDRRLLSITVTTLLDENDGIGVGAGTSLREAIFSAAPGTTIDFNPALTSAGPGVILLQHGPLVVAKSLTITGPGARLLTIDASAQDSTPASKDGNGIRVFLIDDGNSELTSEIAISGVTVTGGDALGRGGGISAEENLDLTGVVVRNNGAQAVVSAVAIPAHGGGVYAGGNLTIVDSAIYDNQAIGGFIPGFPFAVAAGGGAFARGSLVVENSTVANNVVQGPFSGGGGLATSGLSAVMRIGHSTIANNSAPFGGGFSGRNDGVVLLELNHSIVAGNTATTARDLGSPATARYSLIGDPGNETIVDLGGNQIGTTAALLAAELSPLAYHGGAMPVMSLLPGSPAIDAGDPAAADGAGGVPVYELRGAGYPRVSGGRIDIGATEDVFEFVVDSLVDELDGDVSEGDFTLREAIELANLASEPVTIQFAAALTSGGPASIVLQYGEMVIARSMTIVGPGSHLMTIDAHDPTPNSKNGDGGRVFTVYDGDSGALSDVAIEGLTLTGGDTAGGASGGAIANAENLRLSACLLTGNSASGSGGALYHALGALDVIGCTLTNNTALLTPGTRGGAIGMLSGTVRIEGSTISNNQAINNGGGIAIWSGAGTIVDSLVDFNRSQADHGGGIYVESGSLSVVGSKIRNNIGGDGGGIRSNGTLHVADSVISGNRGRDGAGVYHVGDMTIARTTISGNVATSNGGGVYSSQGNLTVEDSTISGNAASNNGGGVRVNSGIGRTITLTQVTISGNRATHNAGGLELRLDSGSTVRVAHSTVTLNTAGRIFPTVDGLGGGIVASGGEPVVLDHTIVAKNDDVTNYGEDLVGAFDARFSLIGVNGGSNLTATPSGAPDANGNVIGPVIMDPLRVSIQMAAMGDFESGAGGDSFVFEYSLDGGAWTPLFTSAVDDNATRTYNLQSGMQVSLDDPLSVNGMPLNNVFQYLTADIPNTGAAVSIRFTAATEGSEEAFAWRDLLVSSTGGGGPFGRVASYAVTDLFTEATSDEDPQILGAMFGIRSRSTPGSPELPFAVVDDSASNSSDMLGIIRSTDPYRFFGAVGANTRSAAWTFTVPGRSVDPKLSVLSNHGGPTLTHVPQAGSPALDAGELSLEAGLNGTPAHDQRGAPFTRIDGTRIDIGAYERQSFAMPLVVDTLVDERDNDFGIGDLSLREAIDLANGSENTIDVIQFAPALTSGGPATIVLRMGELWINGSVTLEGPGADLLTIDASGNDPTPSIKNGDGSRVLRIGNGQTIPVVEVGGLTLTGGDASDIGGGIWSAAELDLHDVVIVANAATQAGGGVLLAFLSNVHDVIITRNFAAKGGGASVHSNVSFNHSEITNNAAQQGGGIWSSGHLELVSSEISGNNASSHGGGVYSQSQYLRVIRSAVINNTAGGAGGGLRLFTPLFSGAEGGLIDQTVISGNSAANGGGVHSSTDIPANIVSGAASVIAGEEHEELPAPVAPPYILPTMISNSTIHGNSARDYGGGIDGMDGTFELASSTVSGNISGADGAGIIVRENTSYYASKHTQIRHSTITGNRVQLVGSPSARGAGLLVEEPMFVVLVENTILAGNTHGAVAPADVLGKIISRSSLIGVNLYGQISELGGTLIGSGEHPIDPLLGPLANNGGPTHTHALLAGSPAIDAGSLAAYFGDGTTPKYDQRGAPFGRRYGGRIDIGAYEAQPVEGGLGADFNDDGNIDGDDFLLWQRGLGIAVGAGRTQGDADGDHDVDRDDLEVWKMGVGPNAAVAAVVAAAEPDATAAAVAAGESASAAIVDVIFSGGDFASLLGSAGVERAARGRWRPGRR